MDRKIIKNLCTWYSSSDRKPLIIRGARQVGKTWVVRYLSKQLNLELLELNFERNPNLISLFKDNEPAKLLIQLETFFNKNIDPKRILLFLDEIQAAPEILTKLRWFAEEMPDLPVITTGSLLDFILSDYELSMPVGRIQYLHLEPMSFEEFLLARGQDKLCDFIVHYKLEDKIAEALHEKLWQMLREYVFIGGLPAAVANWIQNQSFLTVNEIHQNLLATYRDDFAKYAKRLAHERLQEVFQAVPRQLGRKFKYSAINQDVQSSSLKNALDLLCRARLCHKVQACAGDGIPLAASIKAKTFKVILLDVGLATAAMGLTLTERVKFDELQLLNEGGIAEQLVGQLLRVVTPYFLEPKLYYWVRDKLGAEAEVDYLIQHAATIIPIEVKSGSTGTLRSLHAFTRLRGLLKAVRINADYPSITQVNNYQLISIPAYLVEQIHRFL